MIQENAKKIEKANWLKITFYSMHGLISLFFLNLFIIIMFSIEFSRNFDISSVLLFVVLFGIIVTVDVVVFIYYKRKYPNIYYYKNLEYLFSKTTYLATNTFSEIIYKDNNGEWKKIFGKGYKKDAFALFQEDFVKQNISEAVETIESGGKKEFPFRKSYKLDWNFNIFSKKFKIGNFENLQTIKVSKESIIFDDEVYEWENYEIGTVDGVIYVKDLNGNIILTFGNEMEIFGENLLVTLIENLNRN